MSKDQLDIVKAKDVLDEDHYGLTKIKDRILEYLSVRKLNPDPMSLIMRYLAFCERLDQMISLIFVGLLCPGKSIVKVMPGCFGTTAK